MASTSTVTMTTAIINQTAEEIRKLNISTQLQRLSDERAIELLPAIFVILIMMIAGLIGNSLVVYMFTVHFKRTTQTKLFVALACFDLITNIIAMPFEVADLRYFFNFNSEQACKILRSIVTFPTLASNQVLLLIAVDRYRKVCCPLKSQITSSIANRILVVIITISILLTLPAYFLYGLRTAITTVPGLFGSDCATGDSVKDTIYPMVYEYVLMFFFVFFVTLLTILYTMIWRASRRLAFARNVFNSEQSKKLLGAKTSSTSSKNSRRSPAVMMLKSDSIYKKTASKENSGESSASTSGVFNFKVSKPRIKSKSTVVAFAVTLLFFLSFIPHLVLAALKNSYNDFDYRLSGASLVAFNIFLRSFLVNSVANPLIYAAMNPTFRHRCGDLVRNVFCCRTNYNVTDGQPTDSF